MKSIGESDSQTHLIWELALTKVVNGKLTKLTKFEKFRAQIIEFAEHYRIYLLGQFLEGHFECKIPLKDICKGKCIRIKKAIVPVFQVFAKYVWNLDCSSYQPTTGSLGLFLNEKTSPRFVCKERGVEDERCHQEFHHWLDELNEMRKRKELTDFTFICTDERGEVVKQFFLHKQVVLSRTSGMDESAHEMRLCIQMPSDINVIETWIKRLYFQPMKRFETYEECEQFSKLITFFQMQEELKRFESLLIDNYVKKLEKAAKNKNFDEINRLLKESEELAEKYKYLQLAAFSRWSTQFSFWQFKFLNLESGLWVEELKKMIYQRNVELHERLKRVKYEKAREQIIAFAHAYLPKLVKRFSHGKQNVVFPLDNLSFGLSSSDSEKFTPQILGFSAEANGQGPFVRQKSTRDASKLPENEGEKPKAQVDREVSIKREYVSIFTCMSQEMWNVHCVYEAESDQLLLSSKEEITPYPLHLVKMEIESPDEAKRRWVERHLAVGPTDFLIILRTSEGKIRKEYPIHKMIAAPRAALIQISDASLDIEAETLDLDVMEGVIKLLYFEYCPTHFDTLEKKIQFLRLVCLLRFEEEKQRSEQMLVLALRDKLYLATIENQEEMIAPLLNEMGELAERYRLVLLKQLVEWWKGKSPFWKTLIRKGN